MTTSELMAVILAYKNGEADWPTTKEALVDFPYVPEEPEPQMNTPEWAVWAGRQDNFARPNTMGELIEAAYGGDFEYDRYKEVAAALREKYPKKVKAQPAKT